MAVLILKDKLAEELTTKTYYKTAKHMSDIIRVDYNMRGRFISPRAVMLKLINMPHQRFRRMAGTAVGQERYRDIVSLLIRRDWNRYKQAVQTEMRERYAEMLEKGDESLYC